MPPTLVIFVLNWQARTMEIDVWWPKLEPAARERLIGHNGEALPPEVLEQITDVAGPASPDIVWAGGAGERGFYLTDEATDWVEAVANGEP